MLKTIFLQLAGSYTSNTPLAEMLWAEIQKKYSGKGRYYHNLSHLENLYTQLETCKSGIQDWDTLLFSMFYHDIIYKATAKDNEEKSAEAAVKALKAIGYSADKTDLCHSQIMATKSHTVSDDNDTNLFTDADLSIVGSNWEDYAAYYKNVRKEYSIYPDFMYNPGRKKVLQHFLDMEHIFKTEFFRDNYEAKARENLKREIELLG
ncbi:hypothetical protein HYN59_13810 [Flavobacterium album]|uniref:Metal-dependent phosphohydrolase n=1 Tax=Flavobacterium album TaxID=2175091 RepID=A0A2S1R0N6_9FLAO|nr:hypothetical protein [Flavobacterium album]AWH86119.1 hypothetical protein HYN59_13810 [Flavobacterium album]